MTRHAASPVRGRFFTPGTYVLLALMSIGYAFGFARFLAGLGAVTNLTDAYPWGIWIAIDVACGVALAAGGFTTAALIEILGRKRYGPLLRPAVLTAWLGYAMVGFALLFDLGRYWNSWRPVFHWQGNSVLFEVGMCVLTYLIVLTVEMSAAFLDGFRHRIAHGGRGAALLRKFRKPVFFLRRIVRAVMPLFILAGVVLSCMHQSSLGTLMVIAPTKVDPLWYTPLLPVLFLLSAVMVGFPMVILESIIASRSLGREPETELLGSLAAKIPWLLGLYGLVRVLDLLLRRGQIDLLDSPGQLISFLLEMVVCLALPFALLLQKAVRRSADWLLFSSLLIIGGVILNRLNVFLVGYEPPFPGTGYFPALGEIALTVGLACTIMFLYRVFVFAFPVLSGAAARQEPPRPIAARLEPLPPGWAWGFRAIALLLLLGFAVLYAAVHEEAISGEIRATAWARGITPAPGAERALSRSEHAGRPEGYKRVYRLGNPVLNEATDYYERVRFTHVMHDEHLHGDCGVCHHRFSLDETDRVGFDLEEFHLEFDVRLGGPCSACHEMDLLTVQRCDSCHWFANETDDRSRPGLKGAYHRLCIGCHEELTAGVRAPTDCIGCHHPLTPDHGDLVALDDTAGPRNVTAECLRCHEATGREVLRTAHWNWGGHSPEICEHEHTGDLGLETLVNNYMIGTGSQKDYCRSCHIGLGCDGKPADTRNPEMIDCLVCHDTTGVYRKELGGGGAPHPAVDLVAVAVEVGRPSRRTCGTCHFCSDGAPNVKHGDLEPILADPPDDLDVHMGRYDMRCQDCHVTRRHRIAGMSASAPAVEGRVACEHCHGATPHGISGPLGGHLDQHRGALSCETCHIPRVARQSPTRVFVDFSRAEEFGAAPAGPTGWPEYPRDSGVERWERDLVPVYAWYDGTRAVYVLGDEIDPTETTVLNQPLGERRNPEARIFPFKIHRAVQPYDANRRVLVLPKLWGGFWSHHDMGRAIEEGMRAANLDYSGEYAYAETAMYTGIHHEVVPAVEALGCRDCHEAEAVDCAGCHQGIGEPDEPVGRVLRARHPDDPDRFDFRALGYRDDPARVGGRFTVRRASGPSFD